MKIHQSLASINRSPGSDCMKSIRPSTRIRTAELDLSAVGLGTGSFTGRDGWPRSISWAQAREIVAAAAGQGCRHIDTADGYGLGRAEELVGSVLRSTERASWTITTKIGWNFYNYMLSPAAKEYIRRRLGWDPLRLPEALPFPFDHGQNFQPAYLKFAMERSLMRLGVDCVDVVLLHVPPLEALRSAEWDAAMDGLRRDGKCRLYGISVCHPIEVVSALANGRPAVLNVPATAAISEPMRLALDAAKRRGVLIIAREVFGHGSLLRALRGRLPTIPAGALARCIVELVLRNPLIDALIVGCTRAEHVRDDFSTDPPGERTLRDVQREVRQLLSHAQNQLLQPTRREGAFPDVDRYVESCAGPPRNLADPSAGL